MAYFVRVFHSQVLVHRGIEKKIEPHAHLCLLPILLYLLSAEFCMLLPGQQENHPQVGQHVEFILSQELNNLFFYLFFLFTNDITHTI